jgi:uncharacterized protein YgiM (DUF1202 family)
LGSWALIEIQDKQGVWIHFKKVSNDPVTIEKALQAALKIQLASNTKKARAVDADTNDLLRIERG